MKAPPPLAPTARCAPSLAAAPARGRSPQHSTAPSVLTAQAWRAPAPICTKQPHQRAAPPAPGRRRCGPSTRPPRRAAPRRGTGRRPPSRAEARSAGASARACWPGSGPSAARGAPPAAVPRQAPRGRSRTRRRPALSAATARTIRRARALGSLLVDVHIEVTPGLVVRGRPAGSRRGAVEQAVDAGSTLTSARVSRARSRASIAPRRARSHAPSAWSAASRRSSARPTARAAP